MRQMLETDGTGLLKDHGSWSPLPLLLPSSESSLPPPAAKSDAGGNEL